MNNLIDWKEYIDYIYCMNYMPDNRINNISSTLQNIGIDIYDNRFFSFIYDCEHKMFLDEYDLMRKKSFKFYDEHKFYESENLYCNENFDYVFDVALTTYKVLKTAQYFNYKRIIIFEDDVVFLKDLKYIKNAMDFVKTQDFDICLCQTTFVDAWYGNKEYLVNFGCEEFGNDMFLKTNRPSGVFGGAFIILTNEGINKIIKNKINNSVSASKRNCRLCPVLSQRK